MRSVVLYCPSLDRDLRHLHEAIPELLIHEGERTNDGADGCLEGHKAIVREAQQSGDDRVFLVEDDCEFTQYFDFRMWLAMADWAQDHHYDVLVGGCTRAYDPRVAWVTDSRMLAIVDVSAFHSAHCIVYFESSFERMLRCAVAPVDWSLGRDCQMRCAVAWPFVAVQRPAYSGIEKRKVDYRPLYVSYEAELGRRLSLSREVRR